MLIIGELACIGQPMLCNLEQPERCIRLNVLFDLQVFFNLIFIF